MLMVPAQDGPACEPRMEQPMILLTRLNGSEIGVNADLIERVESTQDTVVTLVDGTKYVVAEDVTEIIDRVIEFRARILALGNRLGDSAALNDSVDPARRHRPLRLVADPIGDWTEEG